jgi:hypothetical protein
MDLLVIGGAGQASEFADLRKRAGWILEQKAKPALVADGYYDPLLFVFRGQRFLNGVGLLAEGSGSLRDEVREAVALCEGTCGILARVARHPGHGEALLVALIHPEGEALLCAPFTRQGGIRFGETQVLEGEGLAGPWAEALWHRDG